MLMISVGCVSFHISDIIFFSFLVKEIEEAKVTAPFSSVKPRVPGGTSEFFFSSLCLARQLADVFWLG